MEDYARLHAGIGGDNEKLAYNVLQARPRRRRDPRRRRRPGRARRPGPALRPDRAARPLLREPPRRAADRVPRRSRSRRCGAPSARRRGATASSCSATSTSSGMPPPAPKRSSIVATLDAVDALGLEGASVRINDRRAAGLDARRLRLRAPTSARACSSRSTSSTRSEPEGVVAELRDRGATAAAVDALEAVPRAAR